MIKGKIFMLYDDKKFVGSVIRTARKKAGLSQEQLSEKIGMTDKNLGNIENGKQYPQVNNFLRLMEELNLTVEDFGSKKSANTEQDAELLKLFYVSSDKEKKAYLKIINTINEVTTGYKD